jgi:hypothetical protein
MRPLLILAGVQAEMDELGLHGQTRDAKSARRFGLVAMSLSDGACEEFPLGGFKHTRVRIGKFLPLCRCQQVVHLFAKRLGRGILWNSVFVQRGANVVQVDRITLSEEHGFANHVLQLAHVPRPRLRRKEFNRFGMDGRLGVAQFRTVLLQQIVDKCRDVFLAIAKRRQRDDHNAEAVVQVFAKLFLLDGRFEVAVRGGHHAHVHGDGFLAAEPLQAHFEIWNDKAGDAPPVDSGDGLVFPDFNLNPDTTTSLVMPRPCKFISADLPLCSIIRPTSMPLAGATAAAHFLTDTGLFHGQSDAFFNALFRLAQQADRAVRECDRD